MLKKVRWAPVSASPSSSRNRRERPEQVGQPVGGGGVGHEKLRGVDAQRPLIGLGAAGEVGEVTDQVGAELAQLFKPQSTVAGLGDQEGPPVSGRVP